MNSKCYTIWDNSSYGATIGDLSTRISIKAMKEIKKLAFTSPWFKWISGNIKDDKSTCAFFLKDGLDSDSSLISYAIKVSNSGGVFLNVSCTPTRLASGQSAFPVSFERKENESRQKVLLRTLRYLNRLPYLVLSEIPDGNFKWEEEDLNTIKAGNINVTRLQVAWYSPDLKEYRDLVQDYLRLTYCGLDATAGNRVRNLADSLGVEAKAYMKSDNLTLTSYVDETKQLGLTIYSKDVELSKFGVEVSDEDNARLSSCLRFDVNLFAKFLNLESVGLDTIAKLEEKYATFCSDASGDRKFTTWLAEAVLEKFKLGYLLGVDADSFMERISVLQELSERETTVGKIAKLWLDYINCGESDVDLAKLVNVSSKMVKKAKDILLQRYMIDVEVSRSYHEAMLDSSILSTRTREERAKFVDRRTNETISHQELISRDTKLRKKLRNLMTAAREVNNVSGKSPKVITKRSDAYVVAKLRGRQIA